MGASVFVIALAGLAFPIVLILTAVLVDFAVILWLAFRWWHDELAPKAWGFVHRNVTGPLGHYAHGLIARPH